LRLVLDRLREGGCVEVTPCVWVEVAFIDWIMGGGGSEWLCLV